MEVARGNLWRLLCVLIGEISRLNRRFCGSCVVPVENLAEKFGALARLAEFGC